MRGVSIHLHKVLPMGGGVGGGSADGTYTLRALNEVCGLGLSQRDLMALAAELGAIVPFSSKMALRLFKAEATW